MKAIEFFELTKNVREAQKLYFRTRLNGDLVAAKGLESQLDKALKEGFHDPTIKATIDAASDSGSQIEMIMDDNDGE